MVHAQSVDILYAGDTYTLPFYKGGALWSGESTLTMFAVPQGLGDPSNLNYKWREGTTVLGDVNGVGRNAVRFPDSIFSKPQVFSVEIVDGEDAPVAQSYINVAPTSSGLLVYEKNPLFGFLFNREVSGVYQVGEQEISFSAFPLYFSTKDKDDSNLLYSWRSSSSQDDSGSTVTYRIPDGAKGQAAVSVKATNSSTLRQTVEKKMTLQFGNEN